MRAGLDLSVQVSPREEDTTFVLNGAGEKCSRCLKSLFWRGGGTQAFQVPGDRVQQVGVGRGGGVCLCPCS